MQSKSLLQIEPEETRLTLGVGRACCIIHCFSAYIASLGKGGLLQLNEIETYFTVGAIANTHGLRGEVKIFPKTDFEEMRFSRGSKLYMREPGKSPARQLTVKEARKQKKLWIVAFVESTTLSEVETWKGFELCVPERDLQPLPKGTYYIHQLVGLMVQTVDGVEVGKIVEVLTPGANDVYVVRGPLQKKDILLPAIPSCVQSVDLESGKMKVILMPGLLDEENE